MQMNKIRSYINSAIYNIWHNKAYALFCILGTALTFIFIAIILQFTNGILNNVPPAIHADRVIQVGTSFSDERGQEIPGLSSEEIPLLLDNIKAYKLCAYKNRQLITVFTSDKLLNSVVSFVNGDYWKINQFDFIAGRPFTEEEVLSKKAVVILKKSFAKANFKADEIIGQKLTFQDVTYTVIGIVDDYSNFSDESDQIWAPSTLNKFIPSGDNLQTLYILPKEGIALPAFKDKVVSVLKFHYANKSVNIDLDRKDILTQREVRIQSFGNDKLAYGIPMILLALLLIPALNILIISIANTNNRAKEIALRRSMGATKLSSFVLIMIENLILVVIGAIIGVLLATTVANLISRTLLNGGVEGDVLLIANIDFSVLILGVLPLALLFSLLSGGIPSWLVAKSKISEVLKGDIKNNGNHVKRYLGIYIEQTLVFIILMISMVSLAITVDKYNEPGLLNTDQVINFGYMATDFGSPDLKNVFHSTDVIIENLRKTKNVKAISEGYNFAPYLREDKYNASDSITIDKIKMKVFIKTTDRYGINVFKPKLIEGEWITDSKLPDDSWAIVITKEIADLLKWDKSVGRKIYLMNQDFTIVGVMEGFRNSVFTKSVPTIVLPLEIQKINIFREISARVEDKDIFAADFHREWNRLITSKAVYPIFVDSDKMKNTSMSVRVTGIALQLIPTIFLLIFAFIGTFGIFWLTSQKRTEEFALRIAIGSTANRLTKLVIKESIVITTLSVIPGLLLAAFIYPFTPVHFIAIGIAIVLMLVFSVFSAWYPAYMASKINPAIALKYE